MTHRPCGACGTLVPADTGCEHWRPGRSAKAADSAARRLAKREAKGLPAPPPVDRAKRTAANRRYRQQARDNAKAQVAEFARIMGRDYR